MNKSMDNRQPESIGGTRFKRAPVGGLTGNTGQYYDKKKKEYVNYAEHLHLDATDRDGKQINPEGKNYGKATNEEFFGEQETAKGSETDLKDKGGKVIGKSYEGNAAFFKQLLTDLTKLLRE
jgi:hypothetical protein